MRRISGTKYGAGNQLWRPIIGYDRAAEIAKESVKTGKTVRTLCREKKILPEDQLAAALDPVEMTKPGRRRRGRRLVASSGGHCEK